MADTKPLPSIEDIREDFLPKDAYVSPEIHQLEKERLWPKVWQIACREEELPEVGNFVTYDVADESIIVLRSAPGELKAFYNVCQHRGRILMDGEAGKTKFLFCKYHGWRWGLDGTLQKVHDEHDWDGCPTFNKADLGLKEVLVDTWAGWVFVNQDLDAESLHQFLDPMPRILDKLEMETWRYRWYKTTVLPCNWKVALEAFSEAYHVATAHPQVMDTSGDDNTVGVVRGRHGNYHYPNPRNPLGSAASRLGRPVPDDLRPGIARFFIEMEETLAAMYSPRAQRASQRLLEEVGADASHETQLGEFWRLHLDELETSGAGVPPVGVEHLQEIGTAWHCFPNHVFLPLIDASVAYRSRPYGDDPNKCVFDIWSLVRYAPGEAPPLVREKYDTWNKDIEDQFGLILAQDFVNLAQVQKGMRSRGFVGSRPSPIQEPQIPNMHRELYRWLFGKVDA